MEEDNSPATATKGKKDKQLHLRCSAEERQQLEERAKKSGKNLSEYMIDCSLGAEIKEPLSAELRRQLVATSKNLNQLTRLANAGKLNARGNELLEQIIAGLYQSLV
jgi:uncharacterized protein (DUF1778 family)